MEIANLKIGIDATDVPKGVREIDKLTKSATSAEKASAKLSGALAGISAGIVVTGFTKWIKSSIDSADASAKAAQSAGISVQALTGLQFAADLAGASNEQLADSFKFLNINIVEANRGSEKQAVAFARLGVATKDAAGQARAADKVMLDIADRFAGLKDGAEKTAIAQELFGRSGAKMIPFLNQGREGILALTEQARSYGLVLSDEVAKASEQFNDSLTTLGAISKGSANQVAADLLPTLNSLTGTLIEVSTQTDTTAIAASAFGIVLKSIGSTALVVGGIFGAVGKTLGAIAGALVALATDGFSTAFAVLKEGITDVTDTVAGTGKRVADLWSGAAEQTGAAAAKTSKVLKDLGAQSDDTSKKIKDATASARKAIADQIAQLRLQADTLGLSAKDATLYKLALDGVATASQKAEAATLLTRIANFEANKAIEEQIEALSKQEFVLGLTTTQATLYQLAASGATKSQIDLARATLDTIDSFNKADEALKAQTNSLLSMIDAADFSRIKRDQADMVLLMKAFTDGVVLADGTLKKLSEEEYLDAVSKRLGIVASEVQKSESFAEQAAKNIQDSFAKFLFNPFDGGVKGLVKGFASAIRQMIAQAASAKLLEQLAPGGGGGILGGLGGLISKGIAAFGGAFASTGSGFGSGAAFGSQDLGANFEGGGFTGTGSRSGGIDGRGGFLATLHPNETVIDHTKGQGTQPVTVVQNFTVGDVASISAVREAVANSERRIAGALSRSRTYGGALA